MLRALFVSAILAFGAAQSFRGPFHALLFYLWMAYFRPETWVWFDFVSSLNLSLIVGVAVLGSTLLSGRRLTLGYGPFLMILFATQSLLSTVVSPASVYSWPFWQEFAKSVVISLIIVNLVDDERRLRITFAVIALSLGFEAAKQGWSQLVLNPGGQNINDVPILGDNNGVAVGMFMLVPIMIALSRTAKGKKERALYRFLSVGILYRGIVTYSRGGFLACSALALHYVLRSTRKIESLVAVVLVSTLILPVLPETFWNRMETIDARDTETSDASIQGRLHYWGVAVDIANDHPLLGVGHNAYPAVYNRYDSSRGEFGFNRAVHSSWFGVLSELGYPGLLLFVLILGKAFAACWQVRRLAARRPGLEHLGIYATAIEAALISFAVGATFVTLQYCEMLWHFIALAFATERLARERLTVTPFPEASNGRLPVVRYNR